MNIDRLRAIAARAWCMPETSMIEMDTRLAEAFAIILGEQLAAEQDDLDVLCTIIRTGFAPPPGKKWTSEIYEKTAKRAVLLHLWASKPVGHGG